MTGAYTGGRASPTGAKGGHTKKSSKAASSHVAKAKATVAATRKTSSRSRVRK